MGNLFGTPVQDSDTDSDTERNEYNEDSHSEVTVIVLAGFISTQVLAQNPSPTEKLAELKNMLNSPGNRRDIATSNILEHFIRAEREDLVSWLINESGRDVRRYVNLDIENISSYRPLALAANIPFFFRDQSKEVTEAKEKTAIRIIGLLLGAGADLERKDSLNYLRPIEYAMQLHANQTNIVRPPVRYCIDLVTYLLAEEHKRGIKPSKLKNADGISMVDDLSIVSSLDPDHKFNKLIIGFIAAGYNVSQDLKDEPIDILSHQDLFSFTPRMLEAFLKDTGLMEKPRITNNFPQENIHTFLLGTHPRVAAKSPVKTLPIDVLGLIAASVNDLREIIKPANIQNQLDDFFRKNRHTQWDRLTSDQKQEISKTLSEALTPFFSRTPSTSLTPTTAQPSFANKTTVSTKG
jgi:hypothetical protein